MSIVDNDDPSGIVSAPEAVTGQERGEDDILAATATADELPEPGEETPTFLPGEEELEELLARTADLDDEER